MRSSETSTTTMNFWKENKMDVKGYKVFNPDWTCRDKQYTCPGTFRENCDLEVCGQGMHFCKQASNCFNYYSFTHKNHVAEVIARGTVPATGTPATATPATGTPATGTNLPSIRAVSIRRKKKSGCLTNLLPGPIVIGSIVGPVTC